MAFLELLRTLLLLVSVVCRTDGGAVLEPAGLVALCPGDNLTLTCTIPDGNVIWEVSTDTGSPFLPNDPNSAPVTRGIFSVRVVSVVSTVVTSTATTSDLQPISDGLVIHCRETVNLSQANATLSIAAPTQPSLSADLVPSGTNTSLLLSWSMSDCAVQYVVTIINSSDDSVYPNITTSDTNTTVTLPTGVEFCVTVLGVDSINRTGPASEPQCYRPQIPTTVIQFTSTSVQPTQTISRIVTTPTQASTIQSSATPTPTGLGEEGVSLAVTVVPIVLVIILGVMLVIISVALVYMCLKKRREIKNRSCSPHGAPVTESLSPGNSIELKNLPSKSPMLASRNLISNGDDRVSSGGALLETMSLPVYTVTNKPPWSRESSRVPPPPFSPSSQPTEKEPSTSAAAAAATAEDTVPAAASEHTLNVAGSSGSIESTENPSEMESIKFKKSESSNGRISTCRTIINCKKDDIR